MDIRHYIIIIFLVICLYTDFRHYKIYNTNIVLFTLLGFILNMYIDGMGGGLRSIIGIITPIILFWLLFKLRMLGAGDIKIYSAIGSFLGLHICLKVIIYSFMFGGVIAVYIMIRHKILRQRFMYFGRYLVNSFKSGTIIAYEDFSKANKRHFIHFSLPIFLGFIYLIIS